MYYTYIISSNDFFHIGASKDIEKTMAFYENIICLKLPPYKLNRLVYLEGFTTENAAKERFIELSFKPKDEILELIKTTNPELIEFIIGENITI